MSTKSVKWTKLICILIISVVASSAPPVIASEVSELGDKAMTACKNRDYDTAITYWDKLIELGDTDAYLGRGLTYYQKNDYEKAITDLDKTIRLKPIPYAFEMRGDVYSRENNHAKAVDDYSESIKLDPKNGGVYLSRAEQNLFQNYFDAALIDCNTAIMILSDTSGTNDLLVQAYVTRGIALERKNEHARAFDDYDKVIRLDTNNAAAYNGRGLMFFWKGEYANAISDCKEAIRLAPKQSSPYDRLAWILAVCPDAKYRDGQKSLEISKKACEMTAWKDPVCLTTLAAAYAEIGNYQEAEKIVEKCLGMGIPPDFEKEIQQQLDLYKQKKPYRVEPLPAK